MTAIAKCRSCDAGIVWAVTTNGHRMPLDAVPSPEGTFVLIRSLNSDPLTCSIAALTAALPPDKVALHVSHFATCPNAESHRRPKR